MTGALDVTDTCERLARIVVPQLADLCAVDLLDRPGSAAAHRVAVAAREPADEELLLRLADVRRYRAGAPGETGAVLAGPRPRCCPTCPTGVPSAPTPAAAAYDRLRLRSAIVVPLRARGHVLGAPRSTRSTPTAAATHSATCTWPATSRPRRARRRQRAPLRDRARRGVTLQHSLLPTLPTMRA